MALALVLGSYYNYIFVILAATFSRNFSHDSFWLDNLITFIKYVDARMLMTGPSLALGQLGRSPRPFSGVA